MHFVYTREIYCFLCNCASIYIVESNTLVSCTNMFGSMQTLLCGSHCEADEQEMVDQKSAKVTLAISVMLWHRVNCTEIGNYIFLQYVIQIVLGPVSQSRSVGYPAVFGLNFWHYNAGSLFTEVDHHGNLQSRDPLEGSD